MEKIITIFEERAELTPSELLEALSTYGEKFKMVTIKNGRGDEVLGTTIELIITERSATEEEKLLLEEQIKNLREDISHSVDILDTLRNKLKALR